MYRNHERSRQRMKKEPSNKDRKANPIPNEELTTVNEISYDEKTGQPLPQPKDYDEIEY